jgi:hypothetical protein
VIDSKVGATQLGTAIATLIWILLAAFVDQVSARLDGAEIVTVTGVTAVIISSVLGYFTPNDSSVPPDSEIPGGTHATDEEEVN